MPFPWKQGDEADEGPDLFLAKDAANGHEQDAEYLEPLRKALADMLAIGKDPYALCDSPDEWADSIIDGLTEKGWRFVTVKDWREMSHAWVMGALR